MRASNLTFRTLRLRRMRKYREDTSRWQKMKGKEVYEEMRKERTAEVEHELGRMSSMKKNQLFVVGRRSIRSTEETREDAARPIERFCKSKRIAIEKRFCASGYFTKLPAPLKVGMVGKGEVLSDSKLQGKM